MKFKSNFFVLFLGVLFSAGLTSSALAADEKAFIFKQEGSGAITTASTLLVNGGIPDTGTISGVTINAFTYFTLFRALPIAGAKDSSSTGLSANTSLIKSGKAAAFNVPTGTDPNSNVDLSTFVMDSCEVSTLYFDILDSGVGRKDAENKQRFLSGQSSAVGYMYTLTDAGEVPASGTPYTAAISFNKYFTTDAQDLFNQLDIDSVDVTSPDSPHKFGGTGVLLSPIAPQAGNRPPVIIPAIFVDNTSSSPNFRKPVVEYIIFKKQNDELLSFFPIAVFPTPLANAYAGSDPYPTEYRGDPSGVPDLTLNLEGLYPENYTEVRITNMTSGVKRDFPIFRNSYTTGNYNNTANNPSTDPEFESNVRKNFSTADELSDGDDHIADYANISLDPVSPPPVTIPISQYVTGSGKYKIEVYTHTPNVDVNGGWGWAKIPLSNFSGEIVDIINEVKIDNMNIIQAPK